MTSQDHNSIMSQSTVEIKKLSLSKPVQLFAAFLLGAGIMYGAAFLQTAEVHNAAHDVRHSAGFPCH